uniref:Protein phosphatase 1 regulatory subunit 37-like protein n=1 Tax=Schistosoma haematobium TaxID=6185 RepID=A0A095C9P1_SCHHA
MITRSSMNKLATGLIRCTRLTTLQLSGNLNIGSSGLFDLKSSLISCPCLKRLGIAFCGIDHDGAACITEILLKTTSRFKIIDLTGNPIGIENCLALLNSSAYLDEKVRIIGLEFQPSSLMQYARQLSEKENNSLLHQSNVSPIFVKIYCVIITLGRYLTMFRNNSQVQSDGLTPDRDYQRLKHKNRRHSQISSSKHSIYRKTKFTSLPTIDYNHKPYSELNPKYLWGDSSDDEDKVNETDDNNESVITKTNRNYLSEQNYRQTSKNEWTKHHSIS